MGKAEDYVGVRARYEVLEAVLLPIVHKLVGHLIDQDHRVSCCCSPCDIVAPRIHYLDIEVYKALDAPSEIILGEVVSSAITDEFLHGISVNLSDGARHAEVNFYGIVRVLTLHCERDGSGEAV